VRQAYRLAKVWAAPSEQGLEHTGLPPVSTDQRPCLIGFDDAGNVQRVVEFKRLVDDARSPGDTSPSYQNIGEQHRGTIVFYHELAGIPAFYPSSVTAPLGLRAAYNAFAEKEELHTDKNRFQFADLIPKQAAEAIRYADSLQAFVLARLLGLLTVHPLPAEGDHLSFRFSYLRITDLIAEDVNLGGEANAVDFLYRDARGEHITNRRYLLQKIEKTIQTLREQKKLAVYRLLLDFYINKVYPPRDLNHNGISDLRMYSPEHAVLDQARTRLSQIIGDETEQKQFREQYKTTAGKDLETELTYKEYQDALAPYCKAAGKYPSLTDDGVVHNAVQWLDIPALDIAKIDKSAKEQAAPPARPVAAPVIPIEKSYGERPCPKCAKPVDRRAIYCTQCKSYIAKHIPCPHCQEPHVPDDLELCWKCGLRMREDDQIECPQCFSWKGYEDQFPCPQCGYDPKIGPVIPVAEKAAAEPAPSRFDQSQIATVAQPAPDTLVQCTTCYAEVIPGARCSVCDNVLEAR